MLSGPEQQDHWAHLGGFGFGSGTGSWRVRLRPHSLLDAEVELQHFSDEHWQDALAEAPCSRGLSALSHPAGVALRAGEWSDWLAGGVSQAEPHIWYFAVSSCGAKLPGFTKLDFELHAVQEDGSELGLELRYSLVVGCAAFASLAALMVWHLLRCRKAEAGERHPVLQVVTVVMFLQVAAQALRSLHLWMYSSNGLGLAACDRLSDVLFTGSQVVHTSLFLIAFGHSKAGDVFDGLKPSAVFVCIANASLQGYGQLVEHRSFNQPESLGLWLLRAVLYCCFLLGLSKLWPAAAPRVHAFRTQFGLAGSLCFLAYPSLALLLPFIPDLLQPPALQLGLTVMQTASCFWVSVLFTSCGSYFNTSVLSTSMSLDGGSPRSG